MVVVPTSKIILLKTPIEIDYLNELTFASKTAQYNYFHGLPKLECDNATYVRKDGVIRFPTDPDMVGTTYDDLIQYNYCMYQNDKWSNKWFYAFIKNVTYDNNGMSYIEIETDVWQSWCFDITFKNCFVEREHVNDDTIGIHTLPEDVEIGDPVSVSVDTKLNNPNSFIPCFCITETPDESDSLQGISRNICGIYGGLMYIAAQTTTDADNLIKLYDTYSKGDSIQSIFMIPKELCDILNPIQWIYHSGQDDEIVANLYPIDDGSYYDATTQKYLYESCFITGTNSDLPTTISGLTPKNNKLFTYPYCYILATNNSGISEVYRFEDFSTYDPITNIKYGAFSIEAVVTEGISAKAIPLHYKNLTANYCYGIGLGKFPMCAWVSDYYLNWKTQNGVNTVVNAATQIIPSMVSASMGNVSGFTDTVSGIANAVHQFRVADITPNQAKGNVNGGDINFSYKDDGGFSAYTMCIKYEYAKVIDDYFSAYGYKVNSYKIPNITGRTYWNYVKTIGCNIVGDIPQNDLEKIKNMFNNGVTLWHNPTYFLDYSQNNTIVT